MVVQNALDITENGFVSNSSGVFSGRDIVGASNQVTIVNGDGSGNPIISLPNPIHVDSQSFDGGTNVLDSYESRTAWPSDPDIQATGTQPTTLTFSTQTGFYSKIGQLVYFELTLVVSAFVIGPGTGNIRIFNFPFIGLSSAGFNFYSSFIRVANLDLAANIVQIAPRLNAGGTKMLLDYNIDNATVSTIPLSALSATTQINIGGSYITNA